MAARFRFRLQPLLDWRERIETEKQRAFAASRRAVEASACELERLAQAQQRCAKEMVAAARWEDAATLRSRDGYWRALQSAMGDERARRAELQSAYDRARDALLAANRERRAIEKLKQRRQRAFEAEEARRDELELDESNAQRFARVVRQRLAISRPGNAAP
ncbi:MAG: flagellar export protein FliJ [Candidatus Eremiobacteraeota bacterium]|nr:flagellar export protein FliJ [Candidatus Eremiobacteraeota bacterium]